MKKIKFYLFKMAYRKKGYKKKARGFVKGARRVVRSVARGARKRYSGTSGIGNLIKDVSMLKMMVNAEKKQYRITYNSDLGVGQVIGNSAGYYAVDITPTPIEGTQYQQRTGSSIKLHACHVTFQIQQQSAAVSPNRLVIYIFQIKGQPYGTAATFVTDHWKTNQMLSTPVVDINSDLDLDQFNNSKLIMVKSYRVKPDSYSGQLMTKTVKFGIKFNRGQGHHIRFSDDSATVTQGQLLMVLMADNGNASNATANTFTGASVPNKAINTGITVNYNFQYYYYDN